MWLPDPASALPPVPRWAWVILGAALAACLTLGVWSCRAERHVAARIEQADVHHQAAVVSATQGEVHDAQVEAQAPVIQADTAEVARLRREVARLRQGSGAIVAAPVVVMPSSGGQSAGVPVGEGNPAGLGSSPVVVHDLAPLVAHQDLLILALDKTVADQALQISTLSLSRDAWRLSAQASAAEAVQLRAALAAQQGMIAGALWKGRIQGFLVGAGSGFIGGRLH